MSILCFASACDTNSVENIGPPFYTVYNLKEEINKNWGGGDKKKAFFFSMVFKYKVAHRVRWSL